MVESGSDTDVVAGQDEDEHPAGVRYPGCRVAHLDTERELSAGCWAVTYGTSPWLAELGAGWAEAVERLQGSGLTVRLFDPGRPGLATGHGRERRA